MSELASEPVESDVEAAAQAPQARSTNAKMTRCIGRCSDTETGTRTPFLDSRRGKSAAGFLAISRAGRGLRAVEVGGLHVGERVAVLDGDEEAHRARLGEVEVERGGQLARDVGAEGSRCGRDLAVEL